MPAAHPAPKLATVPTPTSPSVGAITVAALVASIAAWLDAAHAQYRGEGARSFIRAMLLALVSPMPVNVSVLGPPGTAKTAMATAIFLAFGKVFGARTASPWSTDAEFLGQPDIAALTAGRLERAHDPSHPDLLTAEGGFLVDEWPRSTGGIRAMLLSVLADRITPTGDKVPAHVIAATANTRLTSEDDQAANDRFALRVEMPRLVNADDLGAVMSRKSRIRRADGTVRAPTVAALPAIPPDAVDTLRAFASDVVCFPQEIHDALVAFALALRGPAPADASYPDVSERRWIIAYSLLASSAALRGSEDVDWTDVLDVLPMVYDEGETNRATVAAALSTSIPGWVSALRDLDAVCVNAAARAFRVASGEPRKGEGDQHAKRHTEMRDTLKAFTAYGKDVEAKALARAERARAEIDDATMRGAEALEAREAGR